MRATTLISPAAEMSLGVPFIDVAWFGVIVLMAVIWVVLDV
jgi:hypothetical protein